MPFFANILFSCGVCTFGQGYKDTPWFGGNQHTTLYYETFIVAGFTLQKQKQCK